MPGCFVQGRGGLLGARAERPVEAEIGRRRDVDVRGHAVPVVLGVPMGVSLASAAGPARREEHESDQPRHGDGQAAEPGRARHLVPPRAWTGSSSSGPETPMEFFPDDLILCIALSAHLISPRLVRECSGYEAMPKEAVRAIPGVS